MDVSHKNLMDKKEIITKAEIEKSRLIGRIETELETLSKKIGVSTIEQADKKLEAITALINKDEQTREEGLSKLEQNYVWE